MSQVIDLATKRDLDLSRHYTIAAGSPILPAKPRQPVNDIDTLVRYSAAAKPHFDSALTHVAHKLGLGVKLAALKSEARIHEKVSHEKNGQANQLTDVLRGSLIGADLKSIILALDYYSPRNHSHVVDFQDQYGVPDTSSGMRRAKIIIRQPNGILAEIQLWHAGMMDAYERTHTHYRNARGIRSFLDKMMSGTSPTALESGFDDIAWLEKRHSHLCAERVRIHNRQAHASGLDKLVERRTFVDVHGTPGVIIERSFDDKHVALRPDFEAGVYVPDNAMFDAFAAGNAVRTSRGAFLAAAHQGVIQAQQHRSNLPANALRHLVI